MWSKETDDVVESIKRGQFFEYQQKTIQEKLLPWENGLVQRLLFTTLYTSALGGSPRCYAALEFLFVSLVADSAEYADMLVNSRPKTSTDLSAPLGYLSYIIERIEYDPEPQAKALLLNILKANGGAKLRGEESFIMMTINLAINHGRADFISNDTLSLEHLSVDKICTWIEKLKPTSELLQALLALPFEISIQMPDTFYLLKEYISEQHSQRVDQLVAKINFDRISEAYQRQISDALANRKVKRLGVVKLEQLGLESPAMPEPEQPPTLIPTSAQQQPTPVVHLSSVAQSVPAIMEPVPVNEVVVDVKQKVAVWQKDQKNFRASYTKMWNAKKSSVVDKVSKLFQDYIDGIKLKAHLNRHHPDLAKEMTQFCNRKPQTQDLFIELFAMKTKLDKKPKVNDDGSFNRRLHFAIHKLVQSGCSYETVEHYDFNQKVQIG